MGIFEFLHGLKIISVPLNIPEKMARFRRSSVNRPAVVLTNHTNYTVFCLMCSALSKWPRSFFCAIVCPHVICIFITYFVNSKMGKQTKRYEIVSINISKLTIGTKHSISREMFSPNPHLVEDATCFPFFAPW